MCSRWRLRKLDCRTAARTAAEAVAISLCEQEYEQAREPGVGVALADVLHRGGRDDEASAVASALVTSDMRADALYTLASIAVRRDQEEEAIKLLQESRRLHRAQGHHVEVARAAQALAELYSERSHTSKGLQAVDECIAEAAAGADAQIEARCHLTAGQLFTTAGYFEAAHQELDRAAEGLTGDSDLAQLWYARGRLDQGVDRGSLPRAHRERVIAAFQRSLEYATRARTGALQLDLHLRLAESLAEAGRTDEADRELAAAAALDRRGTHADQRAQLMARIAYRRGELSLASSLNDRLYSAIENPSEQIAICVMQARIALARGKRLAAEQWARRGIVAAERLRAEQTPGELRPWVLAGRREPYELLFGMLARDGRVAEAIVVFDQWQGEALLDDMARPRGDPLVSLASAAAQIESLERWLPAISRAPLMASSERTVAALGQIDLIALAVADDTVWRLVARAGHLGVDRLGAVSDLRDLLDRFTATPTDPACADELGARVLRNVARKTDDPLYVVLDAPLAALPFAALRWRGEPLIASRPMVRVLRLPTQNPGACEPRDSTDKAVVLADPAGDLPAARSESNTVASLFGTTPLVGAAATSAAQLTARSDQLLHLAVHTDLGGGALKLYDRTVSAPEISANRRRPSLVVLSGWSSSGDPEAATSLATAFLAGGSTRVIVPQRPVSDAAARELTSGFYARDGAHHPIRALALTQIDLANHGITDWPMFAIFSNCAPPS